MPEDPMVIELAVTLEGKVSINIKDLPVGEDGWGHLTFDVQQAINLDIALQAAIIQAHAIVRAAIIRDAKLN